MGRAKSSGLADDNIEAIKLRFNTFKEETQPTVALFKGKGKCTELDTSQNRQAVYKFLREQLAAYTPATLINQSLSEKAEIFFGLKPYPKEA